MALNEQYWREIISGSNSSAQGFLLRGLLRFASWFYAVVTILRRRLYGLGIQRSYHPGRAVVSIGNITAGGTGKTPAVAWIVDVLNCMKIKTAVITRGYRSVDGVSDEAEMLAAGGAEVYVNPDRVTSANRAVTDGAEVIVMDDGYQHIRLQRDVNIAILDATQAFGYGYMLPRGLLREPVSVLKFADAVIITRCDQADDAQLENIVDCVNKHTDAAIIKSIMAARRIKMSDGSYNSVDILKGKKVFAFCGIGNPDAFFRSLKDSGAELLAEKVYNDHHDYSVDEIGQIKTDAANANAELIITTAKDAVKTSRHTGGEDFCVLEIEMEVSPSDRDLLKNKILAAHRKYRDG